MNAGDQLPDCEVWPAKRPGTYSADNSFLTIVLRHRSASWTPMSSFDNGHAGRSRDTAVNKTPRSASYSRSYEGRTATLAAARRHLDCLLIDHEVADGLRHDAVLAANELFTNAAMASPQSGYTTYARVGGEPPQLSMTVTNRIVTDGAEAVSLPHRAAWEVDPQAASGRGLAIVDALTNHFRLVADTTGLVTASFTMGLS